MQIVTSSPRLAARVPTARSFSAQRGRAVLVQHLVGLDVDSQAPGKQPWRGSSRTRASRRRAKVPDRVEDADPRVAIPRSARGSRPPTLHVHDDSSKGPESTESPARSGSRASLLPDDGEPGDHVRCGTACRAAGGTARPRRTASRGCRAPRPVLASTMIKLACWTVASRCDHERRAVRHEPVDGFLDSRSDSMSRALVACPG